MTSRSPIGIQAIGTSQPTAMRSLRAHGTRMVATTIAPSTTAAAEKGEVEGGERAASLETDLAFALRQRTGTGKQSCLPLQLVHEEVVSIRSDFGTSHSLPFIGVGLIVPPRPHRSPADSALNEAQSRPNPGPQCQSSLLDLSNSLLAWGTRQRTHRDEW